MYLAFPGPDRLASSFFYRTVAKAEPKITIMDIILCEQHYTDCIHFYSSRLITDLFYSAGQKFAHLKNVGHSLLISAQN